MKLRLCIVAFLALSLIFPSTSQAQSQLCFSVPGISNCIDPDFRTYWESNGGLAVFGYPTSPKTTEQSQAGAFQVQYFERNRLELHPENPKPYNVLLGRLSEDLLLRQGRNWHMFPKGIETPGCLWFAETGHNVCEPFKTYWESHGLQDPTLNTYARSLALFGFPLSDPAIETNSSGHTALTQWFERARLEWHPTNAPEAQVQLGLLGSEARGVPIASPPNSPVNPPVQPTPTPQPTPRPSTDIPVLSANGYRGGYFVGEVQNNTGQNVQYVKIVISVYDADRRFLTSDYTYTTLDILGPEQRSPFSVTVDDVPSNANSFGVSTEWRTTSESPYHSVEMLSQREQVRNGRHSIVGEVRNVGGTAVEYVKIVATLYDAAREVVGTDYTYTTLRAYPNNPAARNEIRAQAKCKKAM